jgi:acyl dehydratase
MFLVVRRFAASAPAKVAVAHLDNKTRLTLTVGAEFARTTRAFTQKEVADFCSLCGDNNPLHTDPAFALKTRFGRCIVPGMLVGSIFSGLLGSVVPGTIYVSQSLKWLRPVFMDEVTTAVVTIRQIDRKFVTLDTSVKIARNGVDEEAVEGEAVVYIPSIGIE